MQQLHNKTSYLFTQTLEFKYRFTLSLSLLPINHVSKYAVTYEDLQVQRMILISLLKFNGKEKSLAQNHTVMDRNYLEVIIIN